MAKILKDKCGSWYGSDVYLTLSQQKFNGKSAINYFKNISSYDLTNNSICAVLGNMAFESTLNPQLSERGGGSGYGLVQWTPKSNLTSRAKAIKQGSTYDTMFTQLSVIDYEVKTKKQWIKTTRYPLTFEEFVTDSTHDILYLTGAWLCNYERPADQSDINIARRCNGDSGHMGSLDFVELVGSDVSADGNINGFIAWCEKIANNNQYLYKLGAGHGVDWNYSGLYFDCSSFVSFGLHNGGGYALDTQFTTANQKAELTELGFYVFNYSNKNDLKRGDIVFYNNADGGHTEVVYETDSNGATKLVGAHTDELPPDEQISITNWYEGGWQYVARPAGGSSPPIYNRKKRKGMIFCYNRMR